VGVVLDGWQSGNVEAVRPTLDVDPIKILSVHRSERQFRHREAEAFRHAGDRAMHMWGLSASADK